MGYYLRLYIMCLLLMVPQYAKYMEKARLAREEQERYYQEQIQQYDKQQEEDFFTCETEIMNEKKPEVSSVFLKAKSIEKGLGKPSIRDVYETDYMSSGVVGLVGVPVSVTYNELGSADLTFYYRPEKLRGIPERNLIILHETAYGDFVQVGFEELDTERNSVTVEISESGVYLLADRYQWYSVWGQDVSEYAYEVNPLDYESDWERECNTGSIMEIADKEWAIENAPYFHVSTPEQLAGVVYYNNAIMDYGVNGGALEVYLENDIDLAGYDWVPMGWLGPMNNRFDGVFNGQGHTIKNMSISIPYNNHCAFIGYSTGVNVCNVTFENAVIDGGYYTGIVGGEIYISREWENVNVSGVIKNARGEIGSIIGREAYLNFKNCSADVTYIDYAGNEKPLEYFSHRLEVIANTEVTEDFLLTLNEDKSVTRSTSDKEFRNLMWHLDVEGVQILQRGADTEETFNAYSYFADYLYEGKKCSIWLDAFTGETYTRVSNVIEY